MPFCLCWANENWTRRWDGNDEEVLIGQTYSENDDRAHLHELVPYFLDPRYIRIDGKPIFLVYRASKLPNPLATTSTWRETARKHGIADLYLIKVESFHTERSEIPELDGFDAALDFQPDWGSLPVRLQASNKWKLLNKLGLAQPNPMRENAVFNYDQVVNAMLQRRPVHYPQFPCVTPGWDNTARRMKGGATIFKDSSPEAYGRWLRATLNDSTTLDKLPEPIIFINAWNEWAEGNHLEPDLRWGHAYLQTTLEALESNE
jgi:lipopolysaccharide biosynthesis protein